MSEDKTIILSELYPITLWIQKGDSPQQEYRFTKNFSIGRQDTNDIQLFNRSVGRRHLTVIFENREWWVQDSNSVNGTFLDGQRISREKLPEEGLLELGQDGPAIRFSIQSFDQATQKFAPSGTPSSRAPVGQRESSYSEDLQPSEPDSPQTSPPAHTNQEKDDSWIHPGPSEAWQQPSQEGEHGKPPLSAPSQEPFVPSTQPEEHESGTQFFVRLLTGKESDQDESKMGSHTLAIKHAHDQIRKQLTRWYWKLLAVVVGIGVGLGVVILFQNEQIKKLQREATESFYDMKTVELQLAELQDLVLDRLSKSEIQDILTRVDGLKETLAQREEKYEDSLKDIGIYSKDMLPEDRAILRMARRFGESEVGMPEEFMVKVKEYIKKWQSTGRLRNSVNRAIEHGYHQKIMAAMEKHRMPPQFFYLGLQESGFNVKAVGPPTRFGIAKGPWQFLPSTGKEYGLKPGPLVDKKEYDPRDERHNFEKATVAAAKFLRFIYRTEAQASGLLVMASYNWGPTKVNNKIRQLPKNPKDRNFWKLMKKFGVPKQTEDYVFYIFSAAVIGENPEMFGFSFPNPLAKG